jgi:hypothetical protein
MVRPTKYQIQTHCGEAALCHQAWEFQGIVDTKKGTMPCERMSTTRPYSAPGEIVG